MTVVRVRNLYERGLERRDIAELFRFIDWVMDLPEELTEQVYEEVQRLETEARMRYVTSIERMGIKKGIQQGEAMLLRRLLLRRFQQLPDWAEKRLERASREELESWGERFVDAEQLEDIFESRTSAST